jgi:hypothetical protein
MAVTRPDKFLTVSFTRADDNWTSFVVEWREEMDDGGEVWDRSRSETYLIADLPAQVRADLQSAWNGMKAHRDTITPID